MARNNGQMTEEEWKKTTTAVLQSLEQYICAVVDVAMGKEDEVHLFVARENLVTNIYDKVMKGGV